ncbi:MAG: hypothetical protein HQL66_15545, partial [Magnetococcales bacterium]|nr:hypothetical protein [Magnetococcales bacterium]
YGDNFTGKVNYHATTPGATVTGTSADEILIGSSGDDILNGNGGNDILIGGAGNDILFHDPACTIRVDGGSGSNTLLFHGTGQTLDLHSDKAVKSFDIIDLNATSGADSLTLNMNDVLKVATHDFLVIKGGAADTVTINSLDGWSKSTGGTIQVFGQTQTVDTNGQTSMQTQTLDATGHAQGVTTDTYDVYLSSHLGMLLVEDPIHRVGIT